MTPNNGQRQASQVMLIANQQEGVKPLSVRLRVCYNMNGQTTTEIKSHNSLPNYL